MDKACKCCSSNRKSPDRAVRHWGVRSLESANPEDQTVSRHVPKNNVRGSEDTGDKEDGSWTVRGPGEDILQL